MIQTMETVFHHGAHSERLQKYQFRSHQCLELCEEKEDKEKTSLNSLTLAEDELVLSNGCCFLAV